MRYGIFQSRCFLPNLFTMQLLNYSSAYLCSPPNIKFIYAMSELNLIPTEMEIPTQTKYTVHAAMFLKKILVPASICVIYVKFIFHPTVFVFDEAPIKVVSSLQLFQNEHCITFLSLIYQNRVQLLAIDFKVEPFNSIIDSIIVSIIMNFIAIVRVV